MSNTVGYKSARAKPMAKTSYSGNMGGSTVNYRKHRLQGLNNGSPNQPLRGPALAADVFGIYEYYGEECDSSGEDFFAGGDDLIPDDFQYSLPLENVETLEGNLRQLMRRYETSIERMGQFALAWHFLMEDVECNAQIRKMFNDMQLVRRLSGGNTEGHR